MTLQSLDDLEKLLALCRKNGVSSVKIDNIEFHIHPDHLPAPKAKRQAKSSKRQDSPYVITEDTQIELPDMPTEEELMFYSSQPQGEQQ